MKSLNKFAAEFIGTAVLVLFGCGAAVFAGDSLGVYGIAMAFGLSVVAMAYVIGNISGCHINPAITLAVFLNKKMPLADMIGYIIAQILGALLGAALLAFFVSSATGYSIELNGLGANLYGAGNGVGLDAVGAFAAELILTFVFVLTVLGVTSDAKYEKIAGVVIGLTLAFVHILGIRLTGTSVNPARSIAPALFVGGNALSQLWLFIVAPLCGSALAAMIWKSIRWTRK